MQIGNSWRATLLVRFRRQTRPPPSSSVDRLQAQYAELEADNPDVIGNRRCDHVYCANKYS